MLKDLEELKNMLKEMEREFDQEFGECKKQKPHKREQLFNGDEKQPRLIVTPIGCEIAGRKSEILSLYTMLTEQISKEIEGVDKEMLQKAFDYAFVDVKDLKKELLKTLKNMLEEDDDEDEEEIDVEIEEEDE